MEPTTTKKLHTPLEKLRNDKLYAKIRCQEAALRLNDNFTYIQQNAGGIALSSVSSLIFPGTRSSKKDGSSFVKNYLPGLLMGTTVNAHKSGFSNILSLGTTLLPYIWTLAKPMLVTWGIGRTQSMLLNKLFGRKKKKK